MENNFLYNIATIDQQTQDAMAQLPFNSYEDLTFLKAHVSDERHIVHAAITTEKTTHLHRSITLICTGY
jgi:ribosomal protein S18